MQCSLNNVLIFKGDLLIKRDIIYSIRERLNICNLTFYMLILYFSKTNNIDFNHSFSIMTTICFYSNRNYEVLIKFTNFLLTKFKPFKHIVTFNSVYGLYFTGRSFDWFWFLLLIIWILSCFHIKVLFISSKHFYSIFNFISKVCVLFYKFNRHDEVYLRILFLLVAIFSWSIPNSKSTWFYIIEYLFKFLNEYLFST